MVAAWRDMVACHAQVCAALERELGDRHGLGVSDFEVLDRLAETPTHKWRAQDLAESVHLSQSALSRLVDRLAKNGLVERGACEGDRRGPSARPAPGHRAGREPITGSRARKSRRRTQPFHTPVL